MYDAFGWKFLCEPRKPWSRSEPRFKGDSGWRKTHAPRRYGDSRRFPDRTPPSKTDRVRDLCRRSRRQVVTRRRGLESTHELHAPGRSKRPEAALDVATFESLAPRRTLAWSCGAAPSQTNQQWTWRWTTRPKPSSRSALLTRRQKTAARTLVA